MKAVTKWTIPSLVRKDLQREISNLDRRLREDVIRPLIGHDCCAFRDILVINIGWWFCVEIIG